MRVTAASHLWPFGGLKDHCNYQEGNGKPFHTWASTHGLASRQGRKRSAPAAAWFSADHLSRYPIPTPTPANPQASSLSTSQHMALSPLVSGALPTSLFSKSVSLFSIYICFVLNATEKWYHTVFNFFSLTYFTKYDILYVHPHCCKSQFVLFYYWVVSCYIHIYIWRKENVVYIYHIFFIHSSVDEHLGLLPYLGYCK